VITVIRPCDAVTAPYAALPRSPVSSSSTKTLCPKMPTESSMSRTPISRHFGGYPRIAQSRQCFRSPRIVRVWGSTIQTAPPAMASERMRASAGAKVNKTNGGAGCTCTRRCDAIDESARVYTTQSRSKDAEALRVSDEYILTV